MKLFQTVSIFFIFFMGIFSFTTAQAAYRFADFKAHPPIHILGQASLLPTGMTPNQIKTVYHLPKTGGKGTIAIIDAYADPTLENDLNVFSKQFNLAACTTANGCFEKHAMSASVTKNSGWAMETSLDVEWAHAIAPGAKILLVEATTPSGKNLLAAIDYATSRKDVVALSMSFGGAEFSDETTLDSHLVSNYGASFFASSGDDGAGVSWPAVSVNVVAVGGTSLSMNNNVLSKETAWNGSGGGVSAYEKEPSYQVGYLIPKANGYRSIPDVAYNADPDSGFSVYVTPSGKSKNGWYVVGGTSAGAPQWAAIQALGHSANNVNFYTDKSSNSNAVFFRDIVFGNNGDCGYYCTARKHYDYVTGLGSPLTINF